MNAEEVRLRALLSIRTGDNKYIRDVQSRIQFVGLYPEIMGLTQEMKDQENIALQKLKDRLDIELMGIDPEAVLEKQTSIQRGIFKKTNELLSNKKKCRKYIVTENQLREIGQLVFDDGTPMLRDSRSEIFEIPDKKEELNRAEFGKLISFYDPVDHNPSPYIKKFRDELREKYKDLTINIGKGNRVLVNGHILKGFTVSERMEKIHDLSIKSISEEIDIQILRTSRKNTKL